MQVDRVDRNGVNVYGDLDSVMKEKKFLYESMNNIVVY